MASTKEDAKPTGHDLLHFSGGKCRPAGVLPEFLVRMDAEAPPRRRGLLGRAKSGIWSWGSKRSITIRMSHPVIPTAIARPCIVIWLLGGTMQIRGTSTVVWLDSCLLTKIYQTLCDATYFLFIEVDLLSQVVSNTSSKDDSR